MKTIISTLILLLAMLTMSKTSAQRHDMSVILVADTVATTQTEDGEYMVRKYVVSQQATNGYSIQYPIGSARLVASLDQNSGQITDMDRFMQAVSKDTLLQIKSVVITGYASPDGPYELNQKLALQRAEDLKKYINGRYDLSAKYEVLAKGVVESWSAIRPAVEHSQFSDKQQVLSIVDSRIADQAKMQQFKSLPYGVWSAIRSEILPSLRRVEVEVLYKKMQLSEQRVALLQPAPEPAPESRCCSCANAASWAALLDEQVGLIINMDEVTKDADVDF